MKRIRIMSVLSLPIILVLLSSNILLADPIEVDTTKVRDVKKIRKSTGALIADIPGEVLKLPWYALELFTYNIVFNPATTAMVDLLDFGAEAKPYVPIAGYGSNSGLKLGIGLRQITNIAKSDKLRFDWYYSVNDYQSYKLQYRKEKLFSDERGLDIYFRYRKRTRESFYGLGNDSKQEKEANYTIETSEFKIEFPFHTFPRTYFSLIGGYQITNLYDGRDPNLVGELSSIFADPDFALDGGRLENSRYWSAGASLEFDSRNSHGQPSKGTHLYARFLRYFGRDISDGEGLNEFKIDIRQYLNIWQKRIIAVRAHFQRFDANDDNTNAVPIYMTSKLGGVNALRGYSIGRYIDNDLAFVSVEYRYPIYDLVDAFIFLDEGRVYENINNEKAFEDWKYSAGFGIRVWNANDVVALVQFAKSDETNKIYFALGASW